MGLKRNPVNKYFLCAYCVQSAVKMENVSCIVGPEGVYKVREREDEKQVCQIKF